MKGLAVFGLAIIASIIVLLIIFTLWVNKLQQPTPGIDCRANSNWVWDSSCMFFQEKFQDTTLESPSKLHPVLTGFTYAKGGGNSIFLPMWYRFRYVNVLTGGYSDFSEWTQSPVISGSCCLPCPDGPGVCPSTITPGFGSCSYNQPTVGISTADAQYNPMESQPDGSFIYMNLHRYVSSSATDNDPPPEDATDQIVGFLNPGNTVENIQYYDWADVIYNPCVSECIQPTWCTGTGVSCTAGTCST